MESLFFAIVLISLTDVGVLPGFADDVRRPRTKGQPSVDARRHRVVVVEDPLRVELVDV